jgi:Uma2 family endonuclease
MTFDEYVRVAADDPRWTELVDGELVVQEPRYPHARIQALLIGALARWEQEVPGRAEVSAPTEVRLTDVDVYGPDVVVAPVQPRLTDRETLAVLPLVVAEIRSPSTWRYDLGRKKTVYEARGVPELWLVDGVAAEVLVFRRSSPETAAFDVALELTADDVLASPLLPGFALPLRGLFG